MILYLHHWVILTSLQTLSLGDNDLTGELPPSLVNLTALNFFRIGNNDLSGCYPAGYDLFCSLTNIGFNTGNPGLFDFATFCADPITNAAPNCFNQPPVAACLNNTTVITDVNCEALILPGDIDNGSFDPDGGGVTLTVQNPGPYQPGFYAIAMWISDGIDSVECFSSVMVEDGTPPVIDQVSVTTIDGGSSGNSQSNFTSEDFTVTSAFYVETLSLDMTRYAAAAGTPMTARIRRLVSGNPIIAEVTNPSYNDNDDIDFTDAGLLLTPGNYRLTMYSAGLSNNYRWWRNSSDAIHRLTFSGSSCPTNQSVDSDPGQCAAVVNYNLPTATDNCAPSVNVTLTSGLSSGSLFEVGTTTNTFEISDTSGNVSLCTFNVTVQDTEGPSITSCPSNATVVADPGQCDASVNIGIPVITESCDHGNALDFDGTDDYITLANESSFDLTSAITIEAWIKVDGSFDDAWEAIVTKGESSWRLHRANTANTVSFSTNHGGTSDLPATTDVTDGQWHHIAGVFDGSLKSIYVDGELENFAGIAIPIDVNNNPVLIGANDAQANRNFGGNIDEVRIWNVARSAADIKANKNLKLTGNETGLVAILQL